jgi:hypothetical protein
MWLISQYESRLRQSRPVSVRRTGAPRGGDGCAGDRPRPGTGTGPDSLGACPAAGWAQLASSRSVGCRRKWWRRAPGPWSRRCCSARARASGCEGAAIPGYRRRVMPNRPRGLAAARSVSCAWRRAMRSAFAGSAASVAHGPHSRSHFPCHEDRVVSCQRSSVNFLPCRLRSAVGGTTLLAPIRRQPDTSPSGRPPHRARRTGITGSGEGPRTPVPSYRAEGLRLWHGLDAVRGGPGCRR